MFPSHVITINVFVLSVMMFQLVVVVVHVARGGVRAGGGGSRPP